MTALQLPANGERRTANGTAVQLAMRAAGLLGAAFLLSACDPCSGVASCSEGPTLRVGGEIIDYQSGAAARGVRVVVRRTGGAVLQAGDSIVAVTDAGGTWSLSSAVDAPGEVLFDVSVRPPAPLKGYVVRGLRARTGERRGEGSWLGRWVARPYLFVVGELHVRRTGARAAGARVVFRRTGGTALGADSLPATTDAAGRFWVEAMADTLGDVDAEIRVTSSALPRPYTIPGVRISTQYRDSVMDLTAVWLLGISHNWAGRFLDRYTRAGVPGLDVTVRRTGGVATSPSTFTARTNAIGGFPFQAEPGAEGEVVWEVTARDPATGITTVVPNVRTRTFAGDEQRDAGQWGFGPWINVAFDFHDRGIRAPASGQTVIFRRTGGIPMLDSTFTVQTQPWGGATFQPRVRVRGTLVGTLVVSRAGGAPPDTLRNVSLATQDHDTLRFLGNRSVGGGFNQVHVLHRRGSRQAWGGATVQFRRTGGIALLQDTVSVATESWGGFNMPLRTRAEGSVQGELWARDPGGPLHFVGRTTYFTEKADTARFGANWFAGPGYRYYGCVVDPAGGPVAGAQAEFRRTAGNRVASELFTSTSNASGCFDIEPVPLEPGEVTGTLTIRPPAPLRDTTITGLTLESFEGDFHRFRGQWTVRP